MHSQKEYDHVYTNNINKKNKWNRVKNFKSGSNKLLLVFAGSVTSWWSRYQSHLPHWPAICKLETTSRQITQSLEGRCPLVPPADLSGAGGCPSALPRPREMEEQSGSRGLRCLHGMKFINSRSAKLEIWERIGAVCEDKLIDERLRRRIQCSYRLSQKRMQVWKLGRKW